MAISFKDKSGVTEKVIAPGPASFPTSTPVDNSPGPATIQSPLPSESTPGAATETPFLFSNPEPPSQNTLGGDDLNERVQQTRQDEDGEKNYSVGLYDIDEALGYYFNKVLKPTVVENGELVSVPTLYGSPERWTSMIQYGIYRDNKGKIILPLIMYRKTSMAKNDNILFPRIDQLYYLSERKWDNKNRYDNLAVRYADLKRKINTDRYALTSLPNYVNISYECVVWTSFVEQMNKLIEKIQFADFSYWGDPNKFKFRVILDSFDTAVEVAADTERMVKSTFNVTLYGYILTEDANSKVTTKISLSPKKIVFNENVDLT